MKAQHIKSLSHIKTLLCVAMLTLGTHSLALEGYSNTLTMEGYFAILKSDHPFFKQQAIQPEIETEIQKQILGERDWIIRNTTQYRHEERGDAITTLPQELDRVDSNTGADKVFWENGSRLSIDYDYGFSNQFFKASASDLDQYGNGLGVRYSVPLMQNRGGILSRLQYELQTFNIEVSRLNQIENSEQFLEQQGLLFIDWAFVDEQYRIAKNREALAQQELTRTLNKRKSRLVAEVDVLRAKDAVVNAQLAVKSIASNWKAIQAELAKQSASASLYRSKPEFNLYTISLPKQESTESLSLRNLTAIDKQFKQSQRLERGLQNQLKPTLDVVLGAGLASEDDEFDKSTKFDKPQYSLGLNFRYPLGNRSVKAELKKSRLQQRQLRFAHDTINRQTESKLNNLFVQMRELVDVLKLNQEQIKIAKQRTQEELNRHNQGRAELSFVLQSRDNEQNALLNYAANAATFQKLQLSFLALKDQLLTQPISESH